MKKVLELIEKNNVKEDVFFEVLRKKNFLSMALEVSSISSRLMLNKDSKLNKIYLSNLLQFNLQLYFLIEKLELYKLYDPSLTIDDVKEISSNFLNHVYQAYYAPYKISENNKFNLSNNIGIMSLNMALALWNDFEKNEYRIESLVDKFRNIVYEIPDFFILILELYTYISSYFDKNSFEDIEDVFNYLFFFKKNEKLKIKKIEGHVEEFVISEGNEINKMNIETKIVN